MKGVMELLKRFGGAGLIHSLPSVHDFNERLQKSADVSTDLESRLTVMEVDLANQGRVRHLPTRKKENDPHD